MGTTIGKYHKNPMKTAKGVALTRLTLEKLPKGHNSGNSQSSMTSVKYYLQVIATITGKFHQNPLRNIGGTVETRTSVDKRAKTDEGPLMK